MRIEHFLVEGRGDYEAMFRGVLNDPEVTEIDKVWIKSQIKWAQIVLKKSDRAIWFLRYIKAIVMDANAPPETNPLPGEDWVRQFDPDCLQPGAYWRYHFVTSKPFVDAMEHFMSLDCFEIKQMIFGKKGLNEVMQQLYDAEREWASQQQGRIPVDHPNNEDAEVILDFGNGWQWLNLHRASCHEEGTAMGHCGNSPRSHTGDTILSLRKLTTKGGKPAYEPHLTFTMCENWYLSERKGRANTKPTERYHEMILALLLLRKGHRYYIEGIGHSHWEAQKDFDINDFKPALREKLLAERPEFGNALEYWRGTGPDECNFRILEGKIREKVNGRYHANVFVEASEHDGDVYQVRCQLEIPASFQKALVGYLANDPFMIGAYGNSERWTNRRRRARELHQKEIDSYCDTLIGEAMDDAKFRLKLVSEDMRPMFEISVKPQPIDDVRSNTVYARVFAIAEMDTFLEQLYQPKQTPAIQTLMSLMYGGSVIIRDQERSLSQLLDRYGDSELIRVRTALKQRVDELVAKDIEELGDVEGEKKPGDDLPPEEWEKHLPVR